MTEVRFPQKLEDLLKDSPLQSPIRALADQVGVILTDNKLTFFPDYTDHGTGHIQRVLESQVKLIPKEVLEQSTKNASPRLLCDKDAVVIIGATLLHDIAMHLRPTGFLELIAKDSRFKPLRWFKDPQEGHTADRPWNDLWDEYAREARRFSDRALGNIVGLEAVRDGYKFQSLPEQTGSWTENDKLVVGEFIRRHHARLAHEIAMYGFPGLDAGAGEKQFPNMGQDKDHVLNRLADLIGLTARSHGTSLRLCKAYLDKHHPRTPTPQGTAVLYPMALLRIADYLQIDRERAPAVLLQLRDPQSPISVQEWQKHRAVESIGPATDPRGVTVTVGTDLSLELYLQLQALLKGLQTEMDQSTAVLDEIYGTRSDLGLDQLTLQTRRVYSNMDSLQFRQDLPYVPERTGFSTDPNLLALLVEPLYGKHPGVGVRELMQNSADAVRELHAWCEARGIQPESLELADQEPDVLIEYIKQDDGSWILRLQDKGIGMTAHTIQNYFLRAGASFRQSPEWAKEFLDDDGKPRVTRAGRFGIGAFAIFLLGNSFKVWTRHVNEEIGHTFEVLIDSQIIKIQRQGSLPIGTMMEVKIYEDFEETIGPLRKSRHIEIVRNFDWFCWDFPKFEQYIVEKSSRELIPRKNEPLSINSKNGPEWSIVQTSEFDLVFWSFEKDSTLSCNGIRISYPDLLNKQLDKRSNWSLQGFYKPSIAVLDTKSNLPLTVQRYELSQNILPLFNEVARDVIFSFIAHSLICGPESPREAHFYCKKHPLIPQNSSFNWRTYGISELLNKVDPTWCVINNGFLPRDIDLLCSLGIESYLFFGFVGSPNKFYTRPESPSLTSMPKVKQVIFGWDIFIVDFPNPEDKSNSNYEKTFFTHVSQKGIFSQNEILKSSHILVYRSNGMEFSYYSMEFCDFKINLSLKKDKNANEPIIPLYLKEILYGFASSGIQEHGVMYVAEIDVEINSSTRIALLAQIWLECLGSTAIPFDPVTRQALIERGRQHPELKRHIEAWEEMERTGSKWADIYTY